MNIRRSTKDIQSRLRTARLDRGISLDEVASATHYSLEAVQLAELGLRYRGKKKDPRRDQFWSAMEKFYGISKEELQR